MAELTDVIGRVASDADLALVVQIRESLSVREELGGQLSRRQDLFDVELGSILPGLKSAADPPPHLREVSVRASNTLGRAGLTDWTVLARMTPLGLRMLPNCGMKTLREMLAVAVLGWTEGVEGPGERRPGSPEVDDLEQAATDNDVVAETAAARSSLVTALSSVWATGGFETLGELLDAAPHADDASVFEALAVLRAVRLGDLDSPSRSVVEEWQGLLAFDARQLLVLRERLSPEWVQRRATLDDVGRQLGVTRERVRQMETRIREVVRARLADFGVGELRHLVARAQMRLGEICTAAALEETIEQLFADSIDRSEVDPIAARSAVGVMMSPRHHHLDLWSTDRGLSALRELDEAYASLSVGSVVGGDEIEDRLGRAQIPPECQPEMLRHLGMRKSGEVLVVWGKTIADHAVAALSASGQPLSLESLHERVDPDLNPRSIAGRVQADPRILRLGKNLYGLLDWGGREYHGIIEAIEREIEEAGGPVPLAELVQRLTRDFGVSESSVRGYASQRRFILRGGCLALRSSDDPERAVRSAPIDHARGAFRIDDVWHLRQEVQDEQLRGSGRMISNAVALTAGLEPDLAFGLDFEGGTIMFSWTGGQPYLGSIRPILAACACAEGDLVFLPLEGPEPRRVKVRRGAERASQSGPGRLAIEMGLEAHGDPGVLRQRVTQGIGLPAGATWDDVEDRLLERGESELAALAPARVT